VIDIYRYKNSVSLRISNLILCHILGLISPQFYDGIQPISGPITGQTYQPTSLLNPKRIHSIFLKYEPGSITESYLDPPLYIQPTMPSKLD